ncbi:MAG: Mitogen-activated protein kinase kinase kinase kinase 4 [Marteilia pararefringens]
MAFPLNKKKPRVSEGIKSFGSQYSAAQQNGDSDAIIPRNTKNIEEIYKPISLLGSGSFGKVYKSRKIDTGEIVAIKVLETREDDTATRNEINMLKKVKHPNIIGFIGYMKLRKESYIIMEYCTTNLTSFMQKIRKNIDSLNIDNRLQTMVYYFISEVAIGLSHMHSLQVLHRDIKGQNVLLKADASVKLCDFGISRVLIEAKTKSDKNSSHNKDYLIQGTVIGTPHFMAPEVIKRTSKPTEKYGIKSDIYSLGSLVQEISTGRPPFANFHGTELFSKLSQGQIFKMDEYKFKYRVSPEVFKHFCSLVNEKPHKRPSAAECVAFMKVQFNKEFAIQTVRAIIAQKYSNELESLSKQPVEKSVEASPQSNQLGKRQNQGQNDLKQRPSAMAVQVVAADMKYKYEHESIDKRSSLTEDESLPITLGAISNSTNFYNRGNTLIYEYSKDQKTVCHVQLKGNSKYNSKIVKIIPLSESFCFMVSNESTPIASKILYYSHEPNRNEIIAEKITDAFVNRSLESPTQYLSIISENYASGGKQMQSKTSPQSYTHLKIMCIEKRVGRLETKMIDKIPKQPIKLFALTVIDDEICYVYNNANGTDFNMRYFSLGYADTSENFFRKSGESKAMNVQFSISKECGDSQQVVWGFFQDMIICSQLGGILLKRISLLKDFHFYNFHSNSIIRVEKDGIYRHCLENGKETLLKALPDTLETKLLDYSDDFIFVATKTSNDTYIRLTVPQNYNLS